MHAVELFKYLFQIFFLNTYSVILNRNHQLARFIPGLHFQFQIGIRSLILHRIIHQIENHIRKMHFICKDIRVCCVQFRLYITVITFYLQGECIDNTGNQLIGIQFLHF